MIVPDRWLVPANAKRIVVHWTGGAGVPSSLDREHYHILLDRDGRLHRGKLPISANDSTADGEYAAHVRGMNTGTIGVSLCGMFEAMEVPFIAGAQPITASQWVALVKVLADLAEHYEIPATPQGMCTHAEVEHVHGVRQRGKWDITVDPTLQPLRVESATVVGDRLRALVEAELTKRASAALRTPPASDPVETTLAPGATVYLPGDHYQILVSKLGGIVITREAAK